jgi:hypothetical protein
VIVDGSDRGKMQEHERRKENKGEGLRYSHTIFLKCSRALSAASSAEHMITEDTDF